MSAPAATVAGGAGGERLGTRRVYILPTRHGVGFGAVLLVMLLGAINYNNSLAYLLTFLLLSAGLVGMLHTWRNLYGLRVSLGAPRPAFAGGRAGLPLLLDNPERLPRQVLLAWLPAGAKAGIPAQRTALAAGSQATLTLECPAPRRGRLAMGKVVVATRWPLGLFRAWTVLHDERECLVYPRPAGRRELPGSAVAAAHGRTGPGAGSDDFAGLRDYQVGDPPRHIHWKAVAREQGVPVKVFSGAAAAELLLDYDATPPADAETRLSQLCLWLLEADARGLRYGLRLPGLELPAGEGEAHRERCLAALATWGLPGEAASA